MALDSGRGVISIIHEQTGKGGAAGGGVS